MALRKAKSPTATPKSRASLTTAQRRSSREQSGAATDAADLNRLLREAAWSRMFGRVESKNPFAR